MDYTSTATLIASAVACLTAAGYRVERLGRDLWRLTAPTTDTVTVCLTASLIDRAERLGLASEDEPAS